MVKEALDGLQSLGASIDVWDYFVIYFMAKRLDSESCEAWELYQGNTTQPATFSESFMDGRTRALEMVAARSTDKPTRATKFGPKSKPPTRVNAATNPTSKCSYCNDEHYILRCPGFFAKPVIERR